MLSRLAKIARSVPNLVVAQRVIDKMAAAAQRFIKDETGEAMVGLLVPGAHTNGIPTLYVLDTISPDESAVRMMHTFQQGDDRQDELIWWLQENWRVQRDKQRTALNKVFPSKWDVPLRYLGDWHKQPGYMIQPSGGDLMTALRWIDDPENGMNFLLAPIVTLDHESTTFNSDIGVNFVTVPQGDGLSLRVDFWYIDDDIRYFLPIIPAVYPDEQLPRLPDYPWHLVNHERFEEEFALLKREQLFTSSIVLWGELAPLHVCFWAARLGADKVLIISTPWNYPHEPPSARVAPFVDIRADDDPYKVFEQFWTQSTPLENPPGWTWLAEKRLIDYIHAHESELGIEVKARQAQPAEKSESAPQEVDKP